MRVVVLQYLYKSIVRLSAGQYTPHHTVTFTMDTKLMHFLGVEDPDELPHKQYIRLVRGLVAPDAARSYVHFYNNTGLGKIALTAER